MQKSLSIFAAACLMTAHALPLRMVGYWGQDSSSESGPAERTLAQYCAESNWDIINVAFLSEFGTSGSTSVNLASHTEQLCQNDDSCHQVGLDITTCQQTYHKTILLSMGGASGGYGLSSNAQAVSVADEIWNKFLGGSGSVRPFGPGVVLNGVDLDIENRASQVTYFTTFVNQLRTHFSTGQYFVSAAPQCSYPDASLGPDSATVTGTPLSNAQFDFVWVQFYNNGFDRCYGCNIFGNNFAEGLDALGLWGNWALSRNTLFFLGAPAASGSRFANPNDYCQGGYVNANTLDQAVALAAQRFPSVFGGVMLFDVSGEEVNGAFVSTVANYVHTLNGAAGSSSTRATSSSSTRAASSSSTRATSSSTTRTATSSSTTTSVIPSTSTVGSCAPTPGTSCSTSGAQLCSCSSSSQYETCSNGIWNQPQSCQSGLVCSQSGSNVYCVQGQATTASSTTTSRAVSSSTTSPAGGSTAPGQPCSTSGSQICATSETYETCTNGVWSGYQSCAQGQTCHPSGQNIYCY